MDLRVSIFLILAFMMVIIAGAQGDKEPLVGGVGSIPSNDEGMQKVLKNAIHLYNNQNHDGMTNHMKVGQVRGAKKQVVSGVKYEVDFDLLPTTCGKRASITMADLEKCGFDRSKKHPEHRCQTTLFYQPWAREEPLTIGSFSCTNQYWS